MSLTVFDRTATVSKSYGDWSDCIAASIDYGGTALQESHRDPRRSSRTSSTPTSTASRRFSTLADSPRSRASPRACARARALWAQPGSRPLVDISRRTERRAPSLESLRAIARSGLFAVGGVSILTKPRTPGSPADQTVRVDATCITHEHLADALAQLPCLRQLKLRGATAEVFARALPALAPTLGSRTAHVLDDTDAVADALAASALAASARPPLGALTTLDFSFSNLTTVRAIAGGNCQACAASTSSPASGSAKSSGRRAPTLTSAPGAREGAFTCVAALGALRELNVSYCPRLNEVDLTAISVSPSIVKLNCSNCPGLTSLAPLAHARAHHALRGRLQWAAPRSRRHLHRGTPRPPRATRRRRELQARRLGGSALSGARARKNYAEEMVACGGFKQTRAISDDAARVRALRAWRPKRWTRAARSVS